MHIEIAVSRINDIKWNLVGTLVNEGDEDLGYEFLRELAQFFKKNQLQPVPPAMANIARLLGDFEGEVTVSAYCNLDAVEFLNKSLYTRKTIDYYLQLAKYADDFPDASQYLHIYELLIRVLERGGCFYLKHNELEIEKRAYYPLSGWFERFIDKEPMDISDL
ncbi:hypothetical protein MH215_05360 [Paenibacillus sp. ACRSA]|uniref:hypothetical protein n=1 Tax=Paenibacillus sp. ACRSA TaxID=2918211 RepID=UPI001EF6852A|nr:hypothetical protein [Paenibacillus sp. ACRSA]MCG7376412.1 hypothetical protein [Paenibacillus sp. ACRSA]